MKPWTILRGDGPIVAVSLHAGSRLEAPHAHLAGTTKAERRREEDVGCDGIVAEFRPHVVVHLSRFQVDLNRPRAGALYASPEEAWGLPVWRTPTAPAELHQRSRELWDRFHDDVHTLLTEVAAAHGRFVVLDVHSYNHRRAGPEAPPAPTETHPDVNLGTGWLDRAEWKPVVEAFLDHARRMELRGRRLDARENVIFRGGDFPRWVNERFRGVGCALAVELKKIYVDEWTGAVDPGALAALRAGVCSLAPPLRRALERS